MGLKEILIEVDQEIRSITASNFSINITNTKNLPHIDDTALTFADFDSKSKSVKVVDTCVLYVDIRKSTELSLQHRASTLAKLYSGFVRGVIRCAEHYKGKVRNIIGDRVMILFDTNDCFNSAVNTAILINTFSSYILNRHFKHNEVACGIGIDFGRMMVTKTGTIKKGAERMDYRSLVWLGAPANVASKLTDLANKKISRTVVQVGNYYPYTDQWHWSNKEIDEFFSGIEPVYGTDVIARFKEPYVRGFFKSIAYRTYKPILMTERVYKGFKSSNPEEISIKKRLWRKRHLSTEGYKGSVYEGDVIFTVARELK